MTPGRGSSEGAVGSIGAAAPSPGIDKIVELESLRGLAALLVVFVHLPKWHPSLDGQFIHNAHLMVEFFFVLSGFVIYSAYADRIASVRQLMSFQFLRFGRLYPVHLLFLLAFLLYETARWTAVEYRGAQLAVAPFSSNTPEAFWLHVVLLQAIGPTGHDLTFNDPAWSISVEFYAYLIFGFIILLAGRWRDHCFALLLVVVFTMFVTDQSFGFDRLVRGLVGFFTGCLIARWLGSLAGLIPARMAPLIVAAIGLVLSVKPAGVGDWAIYPLSAALIIAVLEPKDHWFKALLRTQPFPWLGSISYSLYLSHALLILLFDAVLRRALGARTRLIDGVPTSQLDTPTFLLATAVLLFIILAVSHFSYSWVEMPARAWSRSFARRRLSR